MGIDRDIGPRKIGPKLDNLFEPKGKIWVQIEIFFTCEKTGTTYSQPIEMMSSQKIWVYIEIFLAHEKMS